MLTAPITPLLDDSAILPCRRGNVVENELDREAILFNPDDGGTHRLNETALSVWRKCDGTTSTQQMVDRLSEDYDVDSETALQHVEQLVVVFAEAGLLEKDPRA